MPTVIGVLKQYEHWDADVSAALYRDIYSTDLRFTNGSKDWDPTARYARVFRRDVFKVNLVRTYVRTFVIWTAENGEDHARNKIDLTRHSCGGKAILAINMRKY